MTWAGGIVSERATCVLAPNPGLMTLDGTNTWVLAEPGARGAVVIDPGPLHEEHLARVESTVAAVDRQVGLILLTHGHPDHAEGAAEFAARVNAPVQALDPELRLGSAGLADGDVVALDGLELRVVATPGHTADSLSFVLPAEAAVLTGDTVLGRGTSVVAHPDGRLGDYLTSLRRLQALAEAAEVSSVLPGHGPVLSDARAVLDYYLAHRAERLDAVAAAVRAGDRTAAEVVRRVYVDVDPALWPAAELSVQAQLDYLRDANPSTLETIME
jgi:glyoxylase-like metal-dependent hydrolase (beta-lactamase superfamily II)